LLLHDLLGLAAARTPDAPALHADGLTRTFAELDDRAGRLAGVLVANADRGDRVAVVADNCGAWLEAYYGVPRAGMLLTPLNQRLTATEQADLLAAAGPTVLLGQRDRLAALQPLADRFPTVRTVAAFDGGGWDTLLDAAAPPEPILAQDPDEPAWLLFTSGTTGRPKGAVLTHRSLLAATLNTALARPVAHDDVFLTPFPLCHVAGYNVLVFHLHGRPVVVLPRFRPDELAAAVAEHGVTVASLAPTMLDSLLDLDDSIDLTSLRLITHGAAPMSDALRRRAADRLGATLSEGYGMTELSGNAVFDGRPGPLAAVRLDPDTGEILVRGDQVTAGYWSDPVVTAESFAGDWFRTGDVGEWRDGLLHVVDRRKDIIITGGENVASREVEDALHDHPAVADVAVVGVPDEHWGEAICAVVVHRHEVTADELVEHVRTRLAGFKKPRHVVFVEALPRNASGKVRKDELRRIAARHLG
jgi:acyl-CoA synthetase (AMP-forming)/AMP-acid ligase II